MANLCVGRFQEEPIKWKIHIDIFEMVQTAPSGQGYGEKLSKYLKMEFFRTAALSEI